MYTRINLSKSSYKVTLDWSWHYQVLDLWSNPDIPSLNSIYQQYCAHKKFESVVPIFYNEYVDNDVIGYYHNKELVAFSIMRVLDDSNVEAVQFAWDYKNPELRLGIESLQNECAIYKSMDFEYIQLGEAQEYFKQFDGYEELGPDGQPT